MNTYDIGDAVRVRTTTPFEDADGTPADPSTVTAKIRDPSGTISTYVYGQDDELQRADTGDYYLDINVDKAGIWTYRFEGSASNGDHRGADEDKFRVKQSNIV